MSFEGDGREANMSLLRGNKEERWDIGEGRALEMAEAHQDSRIALSKHYYDRSSNGTLKASFPIQLSPKPQLIHPATPRSIPSRWSSNPRNPA